MWIAASRGIPRAVEVRVGGRQCALGRPHEHSAHDAAALESMTSPEATSAKRLLSDLKRCRASRASR
eukprot:814133-Alexandrium_andersonii.AAC.1